MKNIKLFAVALVVFLGVGCSDWLNGNSDRNSPPSMVEPASVFYNSSFCIGYAINSNYNMLGGYWSQYWTQSNGANIYKYVDQYKISAEDFNTEWKNIYESLDSLQLVINSSVKSKNWSLNLMATVIQCYGLQVLTDLYDEVPLNSALKERANTNSKFIKGEAVYDSLVVRLNKALEKTPTALSQVEIKMDRIFNGDLKKWRQFANTLKLKIYMRQMYARPQIAHAGIAAMYSADETFLQEDAYLNIFSNDLNKPDQVNPFYYLCIARLSVVNFKASSTFFLFLQNKTDSRLSYLFTETNKQPLPQGGYSISPDLVNPTSVASFKGNPAAPVYFISKAESDFLQAEAIANGWGVGNDKQMYDNGVKKAFEQFGIDGSSFIAPGGAYEYPSDGTFEAKQKAIIMQKWISMAGSNGIEAFFETNRTHYPAISSIPAYSSTAPNRLNPLYKGGELTYSLDGITAGKFPKRIPFPKVERNCNPYTPTEVEVTQKVWWDKK